MHTDECCPSNDRGKALFCRWESANEALKRGEQMKTRRRRGQNIYIYISNLARWMGILWCTYTTPIFVKPQNPSSEGTFHQPQEMELQRALAASMKTAAQEPGIWQVGIDMFNHQQFHWWNINIFKISIWCQNQTKISGWWFGTFFMFPYIGNSNPNWLSYVSEG